METMQKLHGTGEQIELQLQVTIDNYLHHFRSVCSKPTPASIQPIHTQVNLQEQTIPETQTKPQIQRKNIGKKEIKTQNGRSTKGAQKQKNIKGKEK
jgi:hypothetical protein